MSKNSMEQTPQAGKSLEKKPEKIKMTDLIRNVAEILILIEMDL